jgi:hypothetical protein
MMKATVSRRSVKVLAGPKVRFSTATKDWLLEASKLSLNDQSPRVKALSTAPSSAKRTAVAMMGDDEALRV